MSGASFLSSRLGVRSPAGRCAADTTRTPGVLAPRDMGSGPFAVGACDSGATDVGREDEGNVDYRILGGTGIEVSQLCLGSMMFGAWGNPDEAECHRMVATALDAAQGNA